MGRVSTRHEAEGRRGAEVFAWEEGEATDPGQLVETVHSWPGHPEYGVVSCVPWAVC